jgi:hypothetical protein
VIEDKRSNTTANRKKQKAWEDIAKQMVANFPERPKTPTKDLLRELWRRMKGMAKAVAREKNIDMAKTGGGAADVYEVGVEIIAILTIIAKDLEQIYKNYDDDDATPGSG